MCSQVLEKGEARSDGAQAASQSERKRRVGDSVIIDKDKMLRRTLFIGCLPQVVLNTGWRRSFFDFCCSRFFGDLASEYDAYLLG